MIRSTPSSSGSGNMTPASITIVVSPQVSASMFMPNSPRPPSGTISSIRETILRTGEPRQSLAGLSRSSGAAGGAARSGCWVRLKSGGGFCRQHASGEQDSRETIAQEQCRARRSVAARTGVTRRRPGEHSSAIDSVSGRRIGSMPGLRRAHARRWPGSRRRTRAAHSPSSCGGARTPRW